MGFFASRPQQPPENQYVEALNPSGADPEARIAADKRLLAIAEKAEEGGDLGHAQELRRLIGD